MKLFDFFVSRFIPCTEKDRDAARKLLAAGRRQALSGWKPLCARHPALRSLADGPPTLKEAYDHYYTVAFAVMALLGANMYFPPDKRRGATEAIKSALEDWRRGSYGSDGQHLMGTLNLAGGANAEATLGGWVVDQVACKAGDKAETERLRELKKDQAMMTALGNDIMTQAGETVVALFLEDKNK